VGTRFARDYLGTYYSAEVPDYDEQIVMAFCARHYKTVSPGAELLELGAGPTIHHVMSAAPVVSKIHLTDYLQGCIDEIDLWRSQKPEAHNWNAFTRFALNSEGLPSDDLSIQQRESDLRQKIASIGLCDVRKSPPLSTPRQFELVGCFYTAEQATMATEEMPQEKRHEIWNQIMDNICSTVAPGGLLLMSGVRDSDFYVTYDAVTHAALRHPLPRLLESDYAAALIRNGFDMSRTVVEAAPLVGQDAEGLTGVILVAARKA
jgi:hypothetical protein